MKLIDTHCHMHDTEFFPKGREDGYRQSRDAGVTMICVGTDLRSSREAIDFAVSHEGCYAIIGIHPHDAKDNDTKELTALLKAGLRDYPQKLVGIGEIGLDYYYDHSPRPVQQRVFREQLALALKYDLPVSFHVRDTVNSDEQGAVWRDFWRIFDEFSGVRGVLHSFTDTPQTMAIALKKGLYIGVNGISTFTKDKNQITMYTNLPLERMLLETDAPFLTPAPFRGKMNISAFVGRVAEHQAALKEVRVSDVGRITTENARQLFGEIVCQDQ